MLMLMMLMMLGLSRWRLLSCAQEDEEKKKKKKIVCEKGTVVGEQDFSVMLEVSLLARMT